MLASESSRFIHSRNWLRLPSPSSQIALSILKLWLREQTSPTPSVHLVLAAITWNGLEWIEHLRVPNLEIIPYIAIDPKAKYHLPANRGIDYRSNAPSNLPLRILRPIPWLHNLHAWIRLVVAHRRDYPVLHRTCNRAFESWRSPLKKVHEYAGKLAERVYKLDQHLSHDKIWRLWSEAVARRAIYEDCVWGVFLRWSCPSNSFAAMPLSIRSYERSHSIKFENLYKMQLDWLQRTRLGKEVSGRIWEHIWQYFFIKKANNQS